MLFFSEFANCREDKLSGRTECCIRSCTASSASVTSRHAGKLPKAAAGASTIASHRADWRGSLRSAGSGRQWIRHYGASGGTSPFVFRPTFQYRPLYYQREEIERWQLRTAWSHSKNKLTSGGATFADDRPFIPSI